MLERSIPSTFGNLNTRHFKSFMYSSDLVEQFKIFEKYNRVCDIKLPSYRDNKAVKPQPDWHFIFELLKDLKLSIDNARLIHNALNPDRVYSLSRFRIKLRQETAKMRMP